MKLNEMKWVFYLLGGMTVILNFACMALVTPSEVQLIKFFCVLSGLMGIGNAVAWVVVGLLTREIEKLKGS